MNGIYCDIAVKDILDGEEITIDYGILYSSFPWSMRCRCGSANCRETVGSGFPVEPSVQDLWSSRICEAAKCIFDVPQPLFSWEEEKAKELASACDLRMLWYLAPPSDIVRYVRKAFH